MCRGRSMSCSTNSVPSPNAACRLAGATGERLGELAGAVDQADAPTAAAGGRLEHHRVADRLGHGARPRRPWPPRRRCRRRSACRAMRPARGRWTLSPNRASTSGDGPTNVSPAAAQRRGERGVLGEEAVAGVHAVAAGVDARRGPARRCRGRRRPRRPGPPMRTASVARRVCSARSSTSEYTATDVMPSGVGGPGDADGDLTTVGDQHSLQSSHVALSSGVRTLGGATATVIASRTRRTRLGRRPASRRGGDPLVDETTPARPGAASRCPGRTSWNVAQIEARAPTAAVARARSSSISTRPIM